MEAVIEVRFETTQPDAAGVLLGVLFTNLRSTYPEIKALPASALPAQLRQMDPSLTYRALHSLTGKEYAVLIGERVVATANTAPYTGWTKFKNETLKVFDVLKESGLVKSIERVSIKYVNLLQAPLHTDHVALTKVEMNIGEFPVHSGPFQLKVEFKREDMIAVVGLVGQASATAVGENQKTGLVVDIDVIRQGKFEDFWIELPVLLEALHSFEKEIFFGIVSNEVLKTYEPEY